MGGFGDEVLGPPDPTMSEPLPYGEEGNLGGGEDFYPEEQGPPAPSQSMAQAESLLTPFDPAAAEQSHALQQGYQKALADGNTQLADAYKSQQIDQAKISQARVDMAGLPPETRAPNNADPNWQVEIQRMLDISRMRMEQADMILQKHNWKGEVEDWFLGDVIEPYKQRNQSQLQVDTAGMNAQQLMIAQEQLQPVLMDPMLVADKRQKLAQIDAELKLVDPNLSVFNYGPTKNIAKWVNREASMGGGYMTSGEVEGVGFLGETGGEIAATALAGVEAAAEFPLEMIYGGMNLMGWTPPTNYIEGPDGTILTNAGKVPNITETWIAVSAQLQGRNVAEQLAKNGKLSGVEQSTLSTVQQLSRGVASVIGMGFGFGLVAGKAMGAGQKAAAALTTKGLVNLASTGSPRAAQILGQLSSGAGAAVGNGLAEGLAFGRHEGYRKAFEGGALIAPVLMAFGAAGNRIEHMLRNRKKMPVAIKRAMAGGVEGLGFGVMQDVHQYEAFEGSLWDYLRDPTQARLEMYAQNVIGMSIFKGVRGTGPLDVGRADSGFNDAMANSRTALRRIFARKAAEAERPVPGERRQPMENVAEGPERANVSEGEGEFRIPSKEEATAQVGEWVRTINESGGPTVKGVSDVTSIPESQVPGFVARVNEWIADFKKQGFTPDTETGTTKLLQLAIANAKEGKYPPTPAERQKAENQKSYDAQKAYEEKQAFERSRDPDGYRQKDIQRTKESIRELEEQIEYVEEVKQQQDQNEYFWEEGGQERLDDLRKSLEERQLELEDLEGPATTEIVEGREPTAEGRGEYQIKGKLPNAEKSMEQAKRGELDEGEWIKNEEVLAKRTKKDDAQGRDPLEDPNFASRPEAERKAILQQRSAQDRRKVAEGREPERREGERRGVTQKTDGPSLPSLDEIRRLRAEGPTTENRQRLIELLKRAKGAYIGKFGELYKKVGEGIPAPFERKKSPKAKAPEAKPPEDVPPETLAQREKYRKSAREMGVDYDLVLRLGEEIIRSEEVESREEFNQARDRIEDIEELLETQEMLTDPDFNPELRAEIKRANLERLLAGEDGPSQTKQTTGSPKGKVDPDAVDTRFGERYGPGSMRAGTNPYRQQEMKAWAKARDIMLSEIMQIMEGRQDREGIRIGKWRPFKKAGSEVQIAMLHRHMNDTRAAGFFNIYSGETRTKEDNDLMVKAHEWSHGMHRQVFAKAGGDEFWVAVQNQWNQLPYNAKLDVIEILRHYPGSQNLSMKVKMTEAWAEWHTRYLAGEKEFLERYPDLSREMLLFLNAPENRRFRDGQYKDLASAMQLWRDMGSRKRLNMTVRREGRKPLTYDKRPLAKNVERAIRAAYDDNITLKNSQARWLKRSDINEADISIMMDPARMIDTVHMTAQKEAESFMLNGPHDLAFRRREGIKSYQALIEDVVGNRKGDERNARIIDFADLLYAIRALEKIDKGKTMPLPESDYVQAATEIIKANPDFKGKPEILKAWTDSLLDLLIEAGQIGQKDAIAMKGEGLVYVPFVRMIDGSVSRFHGGRGVAEKGTGVKGFKGGSRNEIMDPIKAMEDVTRSMIVKARKQMVVRSMYRLMLETDIGGLVTQVPRDNVPARYRLDQVMRSMNKALGKEVREREADGRMDEASIEELQEQFGIFADLIKSNELSETLMTLFGQKDLPFGEKDPILAYVPRLTSAEIDAIPTKVGQRQAKKNNGKMVWLQVDPAAFEALMGIDAPISRMVIDSEVVNNILRKPAQMLRIFATDANPAFAMANLMRDAASVSVFNRQGKFSPFMGWMMAAQGGAMLIRHGSRLTPAIDKWMGNRGDPVSRALWEMYDASGASTSSFFNEGVAREMRGQSRSLYQKANAMLDSWRRMISAPESYVRLAEFARIVKEGARADAGLAKGEKLELGDIRGMSRENALKTSYEALEGAREITINFARAGDLARAWNQMTPYFTASLAGQRKMMRALMGMEGRNDQERLKQQMTAWANGFFGITVPAMGAWMMVKDEEWYQDLPDWRKRHFLNMKLPGMDGILSLPLPFELGILFASIPMSMADDATGGNPIDMMDSMSEVLFPYFQNVASWVPAALKPIGEVVTGYDLFRDQAITPFWTERSNRPEDQMRPGTTMTSQWLFKNIPPLQWAVDNPIELEHLFGGYTAGFTTTLMRASDEVLKLKDHPGLTGGLGGLNPINSMVNRFTRQTEHGGSRAVSHFYDEAHRIEQIPSGERTPRERTTLSRINRAKDEFSRLRKEVDLQRMSKEEADRRMFETAQQITGKGK